jgi:hypothetical protein
MSILKCINCKEATIKIFGWFSKGILKTKCQNCGICSMAPNTKTKQIDVYYK